MTINSNKLSMSKKHVENLLDDSILDRLVSMNQLWSIDEISEMDEFSIYFEYTELVRDYCKERCKDVTKAFKYSKLLRNLNTYCDMQVERLYNMFLFVLLPKMELEDLSHKDLVLLLLGSDPMFGIFQYDHEFVLKVALKGYRRELRALRAARDPKDIEILQASVSCYFRVYKALKYIGKESYPAYTA